MLLVLTQIPITGYDPSHPMLVVLDCENDVDLPNMYRERPLEFEEKMRDTAWLQTQKFFIVDGAHRHELVKRYKHPKVFALVLAELVLVVKRF